MICRMGDMRTLSENHKIPGRSIPEIAERYMSLVLRQQNAVGRKSIVGKQGNERKIPAEVITNAIVLQFLDLSPEAQDKILDKFLPVLADLMREDVDGNADAAQDEVGIEKNDPKSGRKNRAG